jgi:hypothetical protein
VSAITADLFRRTSFPTRLQALAVVGYALIFVTLLVFGRPGLGLGGAFFVPVVLVALVRGPVLGAAAGLLALVLYEAAVLIPSNAHWDGVLSVPLDVRLCSYVVAGVVVGYVAGRGRHMLARSLHVLDELLVLARRDVSTGALSPIGLEGAISRRVAGGWPFGLLVGKVEPEPRRSSNGRAGDELLREACRAIGERIEVDGEIAWVGPAELAVLVACQAPAGAREACEAVERDLAGIGCRATFGWAFHPADGADALSLVRAADERLYARLLVRGDWDPTESGAGLVDALPRAQTPA